MNHPYRSEPVYHTVHLNEAEVKEAIRVYVDAHSQECFPANGSEVIIEVDPTTGGVAATVTGPIRATNGDTQR